MTSALSTPRELLDMYLLLDRELDSSNLLTEADTVVGVTALAVREVPGVEQASITDRRSGQFRTLGATGSVAEVGDSIQYELRTGPCVDAIVDDTVYCTGDLVTDDRWPAFGARVHAETGARSMLSYRLFFEEEPERIAGLNLYSTEPYAFGENAEITAPCWPPIRRGR
jgi:hypothetical protein